MRKFIFLTAALLLSLLAHSQEADSLSLRPEITLTARGEYSTVPESHLGNSSFYVNVDGALSSVLSYSAELHLLSSDPASLYKNSFSGTASDWLDWAYLCFDFGSFNFNLGKLTRSFNIWEYDPCDFDCWYETSSVYWNNLKAYQWGGSLGWTPCDAVSMDFAVVTSCFADPQFASGKFQYRLSADVKGGDLYGGRFSVNHFQAQVPDNGDARFSCRTYFAMGHKLTFDSWEIFLDAVASLQSGPYEGSTLLSATYSLSDKWSFHARLGGNTNMYWNSNMEPHEANFFGALMANWYPFETLRAHALAGYDKLLNNAFFNIGLTWTIRLLR